MEGPEHERGLSLCLQEESRCVVLGRLGVCLGELTLSGEWQAVSQPLCDVLGFSSGELLGTPFSRFFRAQNPQADAEDRRRLRSGEIPVYASEILGARKDGQRMWMKAVFSLVHDSEATPPDYVLVAIEDVTPLRRARKALRDSERARGEVARRLINAQESERTRIARELHDDIGQSLAVLKIQMMRSGKPISGISGKTHPTAPELAQKVQEVAEKVSRLSHQLHSAELEFLGLAIAVKSHCRETSERYKLPIDCTCTDVPEDLDSSLALSFLRVVQEALHNVAKHAAASRVTVTLTKQDNDLDLTVVDNGVGFEVESSNGTPGLGLISMRERLHLVGGKLSISSTPGKGTRVHACAPLSASVEVDPDS